MIKGNTFEEIMRLQIYFGYQKRNQACLLTGVAISFLPFHFILAFSKNRRVEGNSNFEITISFHFHINFQNCYFLPFLLLFPSIYHFSEIKGVEGNSNFIIAISFHSTELLFPSIFFLKGSNSCEVCKDMTYSQYP